LGETEEAGMSVIVDLSIFPMDKGQSVGEHVARAVKIIKKSGLVHRVGPMGTSMEGEWEEVMKVVSGCFTELQRNCDRIYMILKVDYRKGPESRLERKIASVEEKM
jgi:uncharacterized protein (TIGR00106 family)